MNWLGYSLIAMMLQGIVLFIVKLIASQTSPLIILFYQYLGSLLIICLYLLFKKVSLRVSRDLLLKILLSGFLVSTGLSFYYLAIGLTSASRAVPLHNVGITLLPALLGFIYLKERITKRGLLGLVCSIICIVLLTV